MVVPKMKPHLKVGSYIYFIKPIQGALVLQPTPMLVACKQTTECEL
jgi:hypothetical protein